VLADLVARDAESDLATREESAQVIEDGIDARDRARGHIAEAAGRWRSRTARLLCDALHRNADIQAEISEIDTAIDRDTQQAREMAGQAAELADDEAFTRRQGVRQPHRRRPQPEHRLPRMEVAARGGRPPRGPAS
jgi:predicted RecB family nuclease